MTALEHIAEAEKALIYNNLLEAIRHTVRAVTLIDNVVQPTHSDEEKKETDNERPC